MRKVMKQWGEIYRSWSLERFDKFSKGGGGWPPLKQSTIRRRRKGKGKGTVAILVDTATLKAGLRPVLNTNKGGLQKDIRGGVRVGYGGSTRHPKGKATIHAIAKYHQSGAPPHLPARSIIVDLPDRSPAMKQMVALTQKALGLEWRKATA